MFLTECDEQGVMEVFRQEGREIGREEKGAEVARKLMKAGVDLNIISHSTDIPIEELKKLK